MIATARLTSGGNAAPKILFGLTAVISAPAANPIGSSKMIAGMREPRGNDLAGHRQPDDERQAGEDLRRTHRRTRQRWRAVRGGGPGRLPHMEVRAIGP